MTDPPIFVFGSNLAGRHGKGAALFARQERGAIPGRGAGPQGRSYGIPTKDEALRVLPLMEIAAHVSDFLEYARAHPTEQFEVTAVGCGLAGYKPEQIAPFFRRAPENCDLPRPFLDVLGADPEADTMTESIRWEFEQFRDRRAELLDPKTHPQDRDATLASGGTFAVGILTGGGFPGAAAVLSVLLDTRFPDQQFPWSGGPA